MTPRIAIVSSHAGGDIEPTVAANLLGHLPNQVANANNADAIIVPVSWQHNFRFNDKLHAIERKKIVLLDFIECGWDAGNKNNIFGTGMIQQFGHLNTVDYAKFDQWVAANPPALTLKRELFQRDRSPTMMPVEWPCAQPALPLQAKAEFDARPIECFSCWGMSNPSRPRLHGDIFRHAHDCGIHFVDDFHDEGRFERRTWVSIYAPYWRRTHINEIMRWNRRAKISVSLPGAGIKCFRSTMESPVGAILAMQLDSLAWSYPWVHLLNCILLPPGNEFVSLEVATRRNNLWDIYNECQLTVEKYRSENYCRNYIMPTIESIL